MLHRVALLRTDVSDELSALIIRVTRIGELGIALAVALIQVANKTGLQKKSIRGRKAEVN
jgi:hypothetical protein